MPSFDIISTIVIMLLTHRNTYCILFFFLDSQPTLTCNTGLTVTDEETGEVVFTYHYPEQCKVHDSCETLTVSQYEIASMKTSK